MEDLKQSVLGALQRAINALAKASPNSVEAADARAAMAQCMKILLDIGVPKQVGRDEHGVENFVVGAFRTAGKAAQSEILDILKNRAYDEKF